MGTLIIMRYPSKLVLKLADHTYVVCGTGRRAWGCFGGKTGGTEARRGIGSTHRADLIAGPNEQGGLACYLINGVCHQAANRIALPANILATRATVKGYALSESLFGPYGRPRGILGLCRSPFNQHPGVNDDLPACAPPPPPPPRRAVEQPPKKKEKKEKKGKIKIQFSDPEVERKYINGTLDIYEEGSSLFVPDEEQDRSQLLKFQVRLFMHKAKYDIGSAMDKATQKKLGDIRLDFENRRMLLEDLFLNKEMRIKDFADLFDMATIWFQDAIANTLKAPHYKALLGTKPGEALVLADPEIVKSLD